jgi:hypothetical protein
MTPSANTETISLAISYEWIRVVFSDICYIQTYRKEQSRPSKEQMDKSDLRSSMDESLMNEIEDKQH